MQTSKHATSASWYCPALILYTWCLQKTVPWHYDCFNSCHLRSCREKEGKSSKTVKSKWVIFRHYALYTVLGSHNFKSKFANESSVAGIRGHANDSCADQRCQTRSDLICRQSTSPASLALKGVKPNQDCKPFW